MVLAGPNGAGKSTAGPALLRDTLGLMEFVNADTIARGLSAFAPERAALAAGKLLLRRVRDLAARRSDFAFETTLASRTFAPWLARLKQDGYRVHLIFLWLPSPKMALRRVADRVRQGGHDVPEEVVRRRYFSGRRNFFVLYRPLADGWRVYDNSRTGGPRLIAAGRGEGTSRVIDREAWRRMREE